MRAFSVETPAKRLVLANIFETQSIFEAAFCLCLGLKLCAMDRDDREKVTFRFEGKDAVKRANGFFNGTKVPAREYSDAVRNLKDRIFQR